MHTYCMWVFPRIICISSKERKMLVCWKLSRRLILGIGYNSSRLSVNVERSWEDNQGYWRVCSQGKEDWKERFLWWAEGGAGRWNPFKVKCNFGARITRHTWDGNVFWKMLTKVFQPFRGCGYEWPSQVEVSASFKLTLIWFYGNTLGLHLGKDL